MWGHMRDFGVVVLNKGQTRACQNPRAVGCAVEFCRGGIRGSEGLTQNSATECEQNGRDLVTSLGAPLV